MNSQHPFYRFVGMAVIAMMLWNVAGWLGMGMLMHHAHTGGAENHCEVIFCSCEIEDGQKICTCHHHGMDGAENHHNPENQTEDCYYTAPHSNGSSSTPSLVITAKYNALQNSTETWISPPGEELSRLMYDEPTFSGITRDLLRPPRA
ncbi:hypothetical protein [Gracilimonas sediminicola]|uniref:Uncharacterized protein n=1 Tax=Gracilimonas sediminicola TaxID=2952158 RepID=A0A9X2L0U3_9BACT|nr:hypothetical protein [Gracilimonas sediminicola]MCP9290118.1 hypothetical protein [Gracilimonas sediminicola]